jgi:hypothetical protein
VTKDAFDRSIRHAMCTTSVQEVAFCASTTRWESGMRFLPQLPAHELSPMIRAHFADDRGGITTVDFSQIQTDVQAMPPVL